MLLGDIVPAAVYVGSNQIFPIPTADVWSALGGDITIDGDYAVHAYAVSDDFVVTGTIPEAEVLIVAGGGAGGTYRGGGGGGGGIQHLYLSDVLPGTYPIIVGAGGIAPFNYGQGTSGEDSSAFGVTAIGGGAGGVYSYAPSGLSGGSGGGSGAGTATPGLGTAGQGFAGGVSHANNGSYGGGGGGASQTPVNAGSQGSYPFTGGHGLGFYISGSLVHYSGGGAGVYSSTVAFGGIGGGGDSNNAIGEDGEPGTGGGGGGCHNSGVTNRAGHGGSGIVIIRYRVS